MSEKLFWNVLNINPHLFQNLPISPELLVFIFYKLGKHGKHFDMRTMDISLGVKAE